MAIFLRQLVTVSRYSVHSANILTRVRVSTSIGRTSTCAKLALRAVERPLFLFGDALVRCHGPTAPPTVLGLGPCPVVPHVVLSSIPGARHLARPRLLLTARSVRLRTLRPRLASGGKWSQRSSSLLGRLLCTLTGSLPVFSLLP